MSLFKSFKDMSTEEQLHEINQACVELLEHGSLEDLDAYLEFLTGCELLDPSDRDLFMNLSLKEKQRILALCVLSCPNMPEDARLRIKEKLHSSM